MKIDTHTKLCAVIGHPVGHSLSPVMHNAAFQACGLNWVYLAFDVTDLGGCVAGMRALPSFRGMSVTIPHKIEALKLLDAVDPMAEMVGCVNTVTRTEEGLLEGMVTDGTGTLRAFREAGVDLAGKRILFIGSGGAARAVAFAMAESCAPSRITILGRTGARVASLVDDLRRGTGADVGGGALPDELPEGLMAHDVIVHATPVGMYGHDEGRSCVPWDLLRPEHVVFDMVYRPRETKLLQDAKSLGCVIIPGMEMLLHQAVLQFERWTGLDAPVPVMRAALTAALAESEADR